MDDPARDRSSLRFVRTGSFAAPRNAPPGGAEAEPPITVITWNIQRGLAIDVWLGAIALREADVLLLCEVDDGMARSGNADVAASLARGLGMHYAFAPEYLELTSGDRGERIRTRGQHDRKGLHGNAILSRWPLRDVRRAPLPERFDWSRSYERRHGERLALIATVDLPRGPLALVSTHLEAFTTPAGRADQMRSLLAALPSSGPAIIGGDLNTIGVPLVNRLGVKLAPREALILAARSARGGSRLRDPIPYEPLFAEAEQKGFRFREANTLEGTFGTHPLVPRFLRPKLDWMLIRDLAIESCAALAAPRAGPGSWWRGTALSDHDGVFVRVRLDPKASR
jgi:endonuclease/exonuclease/phosphatase family metal-dependent hydrolase